MNATDLTGKRVIVLGRIDATARGIEAGLTDQGATVVTCETGPVDPDPAAGHYVDATDAAALDQLFEELANEGSEIDVLVCCPRSNLVASFLETSEESWVTLIDSEARVNEFAIGAAARRWKARSLVGRIIVVTSSAPLRPAAGEAAHAASGSMSITIAKVAAAELGGFGITCNVIAAGWTDGGFLERHADRGLVIDAIPAHRLAGTDEIGGVCAFLASDAAAYINGAVLPVDGGYSITKAAGGSPLRP